MAAQAPLPSLPSASNLHQHLQQQQHPQQHLHPLDRPASSSLLVGTASSGAGPISRSVTSSPSTTSLQLGPRPLSATPSSLQYQSVVAQLAQSHRASQQVGQQVIMPTELSQANTLTHTLTLTQTNIPNNNPLSQDTNLSFARLCSIHHLLQNSHKHTIVHLKHLYLSRFAQSLYSISVLFLPFENTLS